MDVYEILMSILFIWCFGLLTLAYNSLIRKPNKLRLLLKKQGIDGPPPSFLFGNLPEMIKAWSRNKRKSLVNDTTNTSDNQTNGGKCGIDLSHHDCAHLLFPFFEQWRKRYGDLFVFSLGNIPIVYVNQHDILREFTTCTSLDLGKPSFQNKRLEPLVGQGILGSNGYSWVHQRKLISPQLYMDKVKGMMNSINESGNTLINIWKSKIEREGGIADIKIDGDLRSFSGDVISRACFGSNYVKGEHIFSKLRALQEAMSKNFFSTGLLGMRYIPTINNIKTWSLEKEIKNLILQVVNERKKELTVETDFLQTIINEAKNVGLSRDAVERFVVDNCKNIYLAGYETTAVSATWCLMLLASNQEWQKHVREEILQVCGGCDPDFDMLHKMKQLTMVIQESLRLYSPVSIISREALKDIKLGNMYLPKGVSIWTMVLTLHTDPEIWGLDSYKFNPERFANGISNACKLPYLYMPFGIGNRICLGQNLAMVELKMIMSLLLSNFSFSLSPNYVHSPTTRLVIEPEYGVDLLVSKL